MDVFFDDGQPGRHAEAAADCRRTLATEGVNRWQREALESILRSIEATEGDDE